MTTLYIHKPGTPNNQFFLVGNQSDDSQSLHKKLLFHQTSIKKTVGLFRVPGLCIYTVYTVYIYISYHYGGSH